MFIAASILTGLLSYGITRTIIRKNITEENVKIANQLLRGSGALLALLLSLTFADVRSELGKLRDSIELEAAQIVDMQVDLGIYGTNESQAIQIKLKEYTLALVEREWVKLSQNSFDERAFNLAQEIQEDVLNLQSSSELQNSLRSNLLNDIDEISDYRQLRQYATKADPPIFFYISFFGFILTMGIFSVFPPQRNSLILMAFYCSFIGVVIYFILALSNPFIGSLKIEPEALKTIYESVLIN